MLIRSIVPLLVLACVQDAAPLQASGSYRWVDAHGNVVTEGDELIAFDEDDNLWRVNPETGDPEVIGIVYMTSPYFLGESCSGDTLGWVDLRPPRHVVTLVHDGILLPGEWVRKDDAVLRCPASQLVSTVPYDCRVETCEEGPRGLILADYVRVEGRPPSAPGPLRPEPIR